MLTQLALQALFCSAKTAIHQSVERSRVVVVHRVAELVHDYIILQMAGQKHQVETQREVILRCAATPLCACGTNGQVTVAETELCGQLGNTLQMTCDNFKTVLEAVSVKDAASFAAGNRKRGEMQ